MRCQEICFNRVLCAQSEGGDASGGFMSAFGFIPMPVTIKHIRH
jgi:hypothetical protein